MSIFEDDWPTRIDTPPDLSLIETTQYATLNAASSTKASFGEHNFVALLILPILCVTGLIGNILVCIAIWTERRLHNVTNYFLFSLALADMLVCMVVMPLAILVEVKLGVWIWSFSLCLLYTYADVFLCSASIVHISVISLDRYLGISRPLKVRNKSRTVVVLKICFVWIMTVIISCPLAALALSEPETILLQNVCTIRSRKYMIYGSTLSFLIPFIIMTITFTKTTQLLNNQANKLSQKSTEDSNGSNGLRRTVMQHKKLVYTRTNSYNRVTSQHNQIFSGKRYAATNGVTLQMSPVVNFQSASTNQTIFDERDLAVQRPYFNVSTDTEDDSMLDIKSDERSVPGLTDLHQTVSHEIQQFKNHIQRGSTRLCTQFDRVRTRLVMIARRKQEKMDNTNAELANEHKATRVLSVVFACFFTCWAPFFIMNFTLGFCGDQCAVPSWMSSVIIWLGYLSSTLNPVIYTTFNRRFREAFLRIIRCQCFKSRDNYSRSHVFLTGDATWTCVDKSALLCNSNRENSGFVIQNGPQKTHWINYSTRRRRLSEKNRVRGFISNSSSGSSKVMQSSDNLNMRDTPGILLLKPLKNTKRKSSGSLEELPQSESKSDNRKDLLTQVFSTNRRFSAAASVFPSFEPKRLTKSQPTSVLRSTPVLTISNYDEDQNSLSETLSWISVSEMLANYVNQNTSFTTSESIPNIDDDPDPSELESLLTPAVKNRSQVTILPHPYFD